MYIAVSDVYPVTHLRILMICVLLRDTERLEVINSGMYALDFCCKMFVLSMVQARHPLATAECNGRVSVLISQALPGMHEKFL